MKNKIFIHNSENMNIKPISYWWFIIMFIILICLGLFGGYIKGISTSKSTIINSLSAEDRLIIINEENKFNEEKFVNLVLDLNIKHPRVVIAQSLLETNTFKSKIFIENHNLFGMREAVSRSNTALGTQYNHAYYDSWVQSVYDYALWQSTYTRSVKTDEEYIRTIASTYAEDPNYINKILKLIPVADSMIKKYSK